MIPKRVLIDLYVRRKLSAHAIASKLGCSEGRVNYWLSKHTIQKRSISDALYQNWNPSGDPFTIQPIKTLKQAMLYGLGIGLFWGEGTKSNKVTLRLGNTDPRLIKVFIKFLVELYEIDTRKLRFGLQIFSDMPQKQALRFWQKFLQVPSSQFQKVVVTPARSLGTYRNKTKHGVLTVYFNNKKLRDIICNTIEDIDGRI